MLDGYSKGRVMEWSKQAAGLFSALALCAGLLAGAPADAQSAAECVDPQTQQLMNACAAKEYAEADVALNLAWGSAKSFADAIGQGKALLKAQRAWLIYRDAACVVHASPYEGGSLHPLIKANCLSRITQERTVMLLEFNAY